MDDPTPPWIVSWKDLQAQWKKDNKSLYFVAVRWVDAAHDPEGGQGSIECVTAGILKGINRSSIALSLDVMENLEHRETSTILRRNHRHVVLFGIIPPFSERGDSDAAQAPNE